MGQLPKDRVQAARPFWSSGVDFAGPIQIHALKWRGHKSYKAYICLFICMATKAVHLEAVSDLSTNAFIAALERFVARRGLCAHLKSDNGTNFRGADRELRNLFREASDFFKECRPVKAKKDRMVIYPSFSSSFRRTLGSWYQIYQVSFMSRNQRANSII